MKFTLITYFLFLLHTGLQAQHVMGHVLERTSESQETGLEGAHVAVVGTTMGTITDQSGAFHLNLPDTGRHYLVVSYVGFLSDTVPALGTSIRVVLDKALVLDEVEVTGNRPDSYISSLSTGKTEIITSNELKNNACCNLAESFESSASVDVSFSDAITGSRQIQMLGLAGRYSQLMTDQLPTIRGLGISYGLNFVPGPWIDQIHLNKGAGSVVNGYESITGQVNVELKKPEQSEAFYLNLYGNSEERLEANLYAAQKVGPKWSHLILGHGNMMKNEMDHNHDHFLDMPLSSGVMLMDRWKFESGKRVEAMFGIKALYENRWGGELHFDPETDRLTTHAYGFGATTKRGEIFTKTSYGFPGKEYQSLGFQFSAIYHDQESYFGTRPYDGLNTHIFANLIFQSIINNTKHKFRTGLSYLYDHMDDDFDSQFDHREESVPGAFLEYTFDDLKHWSVIPGIRADYHNLYGFRAAPRIHARYKITESTVLRGSAGLGWRVAHVYAENQPYMASSREFVVADDLQPEEAWNYGINFTQKFYSGPREGSVSLDVYRTDFINQVIVDADSDPQQVSFYNLTGKSYSNSLQLQASYEVIAGLNAMAAYKMYDVKQTYAEQLKQQPLVPSHRALAVLTYETPDHHWNFSFTTQWIGEQRLPDTESNPEPYQMPEESPSFFRLLGQVSFSTGQWEFYAGGENLNNFVQEDRIVSADDPFGPYFDSSIIWGPVTGRLFYGGLRFTVK